MRPISHFVRMGIVGICALVVLTTTLNFKQPVAADDTTPKMCSVVTDDTLSNIAKACSGATSNSVCYGNDSATVTAAESPTFAAQGDLVDLVKVTAITTDAAAGTASASVSGNTGSSPKWGIAIAHIQSDLPGDSKGITAVLFGSTTITSKVKATTGDLPTLSVQTIDVDPVLARTAASTDNPAAGKLLSGKTVQADGRTQDNQWVRVRLDGVLGWALVSQLKIDGDINSLTVLDKNDIDTSFLYKMPMQTFTLTTGKAAESCGAAPSGLLLSLNDKATTHLLINGVDVALNGPASVLMRAVPKDRFEIMVLQGAITIAAQGGSLDLNTGDSVRLRLGGKDGLSLTQPPSGKAPFTFSAVMGAPLTLLTQSVPCTVGLTPKDKSIAIHGGPSDSWWTLNYMKLDAAYAVAGYANDENGAKWWKLDMGAGTQAWVSAASVYSVGSCADVAKADVPGQVVNNPTNGNPGGSSSGTPVASGPSYAPTNRTIWSATVSADKMEGQCSGGPINYCDQMIAITPNGNGFLWKGQALKQFTMFPGKTPNVYSYSGPNGTGDGTVTMVMVFTSPSTMVMTETLVTTAEPTCKHIHTFSATFLR
jgi:hypothetical protein